MSGQNLAYSFASAVCKFLDLIVGDIADIHLFRAMKSLISGGERRSGIPSKSAGSLPWLLRLRAALYIQEEKKLEVALLKALLGEPVEAGGVVDHRFVLGRDPIGSS